MKQTGKVVIVGAGWVGSSISFAIMLDGVASEIVLIDKDKDKAEGHALDLMHGMQFAKKIQISASDSYEHCKDAQIVIISAGVAQKSNQKRSELLEQNIKIFNNIVPQIVRYNKDCILLVVTNPLDIMTYVAYKLSGFDKCKVFGSGTVLDTSRLRYLLGKHFKISPKDITAYILGEHGDSQFVWWSGANVAGIPVADISNDSEEYFKDIHCKVKNSVYKVIQKKGATYYAIALIVAKIVRTILLDQSRVFTVSTLIKDYKGFDDICISVPTVVRASGVCRQFDVNLNTNEDSMFKISAKKITEGINIAKNLISLQKK